MCPGGKAMILSAIGASAFNSEAKKTVPGNLLDQPWYKVVIPIGSRAAMVLLLRLSCKTNENMPSKNLGASIPCSIY